MMSSRAFEKAIKELDKILKIDPMNEFALFEKRIALKSLGGNEEAIKDLDSKIKILDDEFYDLSFGDESKAQDEYVRQEKILSGELVIDEENERDE